jgi:ABC-type microcin C transport system permease subunit YejE
MGPASDQYQYHLWTGIDRIRHLYLEYAPQMQPYFILSTHDDADSVLGAVAIRRSRWQVLFAPPGMIAAINSVLLGVFVGVLLSGLFSFSLPICTGAGVLAFLLSLSIHLR